MTLVVFLGDQVEKLAARLQQPYSHVTQEVTRLRHWIKLTWQLRLVLEQYHTLDFVSLRTLQQLPHLPPDELHKLDSCCDLPDAYLSNSTDHSIRAARAEQLMHSRYPRMQGLVKLGRGAALLEVNYEALHHSSSCHPQRHPEYGRSDRLIRVAFEKLNNGCQPGGSSRPQDGASTDRDEAVKAVLSHGLVIAGRSYQRLIQKDVGSDNESLWLLATASLAQEDAAAWGSTTPAAARSALGAISSLDSVAKQSARAGLLASNTVPLKVCAAGIFYIPDVEGPTDRQGNKLPGSVIIDSEELLLTDGAGYISDDLAQRVPAVSAGEILAGAAGVCWPRTPMQAAALLCPVLHQVRVFVPHFAGVIAKGMLLPLSASALPPGTIVLRSSQATLEVVSRPPEGGERSCDLRINKNLLLLLLDAGVPSAVFKDMIKVEQYKISGIDNSWIKAAAAARAAGHLDVAHKLDALVGLRLIPEAAAAMSQRYLQLRKQLASSQLTTGSGSHGRVASAAAGGTCAAPAAVSSDSKSVGLAMTYAVINDTRKVASNMSFVPDLALKEELHSVKLSFHMKLLNLSLPVPTPADFDEAARAGVVLASRSSTAALALPAATVGGSVGQPGGVRLFGLPDPTGGSVPEGYVAVRPDLVPLSGRAIIYRDPGILPGDVRRVKVIPYPPALQQLVTGMLSGAMFLPCVGSSCLAASLAGGDYDGDQFLLLWDEAILKHFRTEDPPPFAAGGSSGSSSRQWLVPEGGSWEATEQVLTEHYLFCRQANRRMGEAHNLWEFYAAQKGVQCRECEYLAERYYTALDAPKTGAVIDILSQYKLPFISLQAPPEWHSRSIKQQLRSGASPSSKMRGAQPGGGGRTSGGSASSSTAGRNVIQQLFAEITELPPVDWLEPALLEMDPDLVLQQGIDAVPAEYVEPLVQKWTELLRDVWNKGWRDHLREQKGWGASAAEHRQLVEGKDQLGQLLVKVLQQHLWDSNFENSAAQQTTQLQPAGGGFGVSAPAAPGNNAMSGLLWPGAGSCSMLAFPTLLLNASACYQAVYRVAQEKQKTLRALTDQQRQQRNSQAGFEDRPRVSMAWRVAGHLLRQLKGRGSGGCDELGVQLY
eukprot:gene5922-6162_t